MKKNEDEKEDQEDEKDLRCWFGIGSKAYNLIYNPAKFQKKIPNSYGENDPINFPNQFDSRIFGNIWCYIYSNWKNDKSFWAANSI